MNKFIQLPVINGEWCDAMVTVRDIVFRKLTVFKHVCAICGGKTRRKLHVYRDRNCHITYYFCNSCLVQHAQKSEAVVNLSRIVADHINFTIKKDIFTAKKVGFRKSDILSVEGAAYDHSIIRFNSNTKYDGRIHIRITERKNRVMKLLGETVAPQLRR